MPNTEKRTAKLEGLIEQMDKRLTNIEGGVVRIHTRIDHSSIQLNNKIDQKFNWLMGVMLTMWVSIIITTLFK